MDHIVSIFLQFFSFDYGALHGCAYIPHDIDCEHWKQSQFMWHWLRGLESVKSSHDLDHVFSVHMYDVWKSMCGI